MRAAAAMRMVPSRSFCPGQAAGDAGSPRSWPLVCGRVRAPFWFSSSHSPRDCSGSGVVSTFVMGIGTALTVAAIATFAVAAGSAARKLAGFRSGIGVAGIARAGAWRARLSLCVRPAAADGLHGNRTAVRRVVANLSRAQIARDCRGRRCYVITYRKDCHGAALQDTSNRLGPRTARCSPRL